MTHATSEVRIGINSNLLSDSYYIELVHFLRLYSTDSAVRRKSEMMLGEKCQAKKVKDSARLLYAMNHLYPEGKDEPLIPRKYLYVVYNSILRA